MSQQQVEDLIKLKFGKLVTSTQHKQYVSNAVLGRIFDVSATKIRESYLQYFQSIAEKKLSFLEQLSNKKKQHQRQRWGLRFLLQHEIAWIVDERTLR